MKCGDSFRSAAELPDAEPDEAYQQFSDAVFEIARRRIKHVAPRLSASLVDYTARAIAQEVSGVKVRRRA